MTATLVSRMPNEFEIAVLELLRKIAMKTCERCIRTYEVPISVMVDECTKELARLNEK